jgi:hypothetical protein
MASDNQPGDETEAPATSLSPVEVEGAAFDLEAAALNKGNGFKLVGLTVACAAVIGVSVLMLGDLDSRHAFVQAGTLMNKMHKTGYERFWNCALIGMNHSQIETAEELEAQIDKRATHFGRSYSTLMRKCTSSLDSFERELDRMQAPKSIQPEVKSMRKAIGRTRQAVAGFIEHLDRVGDGYRSETGEPLLIEMAQGWENYRESHLLFRNAIREEL